MFYNNARDIDITGQDANLYYPKPSWNSRLECLATHEHEQNLDDITASTVDSNSIRYSSGFPKQYQGDLVKIVTPENTTTSLLNRRTLSFGDIQTLQYDKDEPPSALRLSVDDSYLPSPRYLPTHDEQVDDSVAERFFETWKISTRRLPCLSKKSADSVDWKLPVVDIEESKPQTVDEELARLKVLRTYFNLDIDSKEAFDRITNIACERFNVPLSMVTLIDFGEQWHLSGSGTDIKITPRKHTFCAHTILSNHKIMIVPDATQDVRFKANPFVAGYPHIRFYAGVGLVSPEGCKLGTFCILSMLPRPDGLTLEEQELMLEMADIVIKTMVASRTCSLVKQQFESRLNVSSRPRGGTFHIDVPTCIHAITTDEGSVSQDSEVTIISTIPSVVSRSESRWFNGASEKLPQRPRRELVDERDQLSPMTIVVRSASLPQFPRGRSIR